MHVDCGYVSSKNNNSKYIHISKISEGVFEKKQDCARNYFITNKNSKLQHAPFKLVSLTPDALLGFFRDCSELICFGLLMVVES